MIDVSQFFRAAESGDIERVRELVDAEPDLVRARDIEGATALHHAAVHAHCDIVALLCGRGADVNARDARFDATPSGWAIHYLRELGGLLAIEIDDVLHAIQTRDMSWVKRLVSRHPPLTTAPGVEGRPLAEHARASGEPTIARLFER